MSFKTADLCDAYSDRLQIAEPLFRDYGGTRSFSGSISTVKAHEDNTLVRAALETPGQDRVLVVDGGGSIRCAMVGDQLALLGERNDWAGIVVFGCIRDSVDIGGIAIGLKALNTHPLKSLKRNEGQRDVPVRFAGVEFVPGHHLYADPDGIVIAASQVDPEPPRQ
jgi:regulator of ribonuclease activity A